MVLRDMFCAECGAVALDVVLDSLSKVKATVFCAECDRRTDHRAVVNGGTKKRYRFCDWPDDPEFYRGQVKIGKAEAVDQNGNPVRRYDSATKTAKEPMHDDKRFEVDGDIRAEKLDKRYHDTDRKLGRTPIVCDLGSR